jgi:hypothetical protein
MCMIEPRGYSDSSRSKQDSYLVGAPFHAGVNLPGLSQRTRVRHRSAFDLAVRSDERVAAVSKCLYIMNFFHLRRAPETGSKRWLAETKGFEPLIRL